MCTGNNLKPLRLECAYDTDNHKLNTPKHPEHSEECFPHGVPSNRILGRISESCKQIKRLEVIDCRLVADVSVGAILEHGHICTWCD
jgi:hypothetical protein